MTALQLRFPPIFMSMSQGFGMDGIGDQPLITFAIKPHENGDRLLLVKLPDARLPPKSPAEEPITTFETGSPEEQLFKKAIKGATVRFFVELEQPLLRTNAPAQSANRATILDLDLDKMINAMDEEKVRRMMGQGSLQEVLWQVGNLPGAVVPIDHEIFLEYEGPRAPQPPAPAAAPPAAQAPPDTEIYLAPMTLVNGAIDIGPAVDITNNPGYDNQPFFTPDGRAVLFTSVPRRRHPDRHLSLRHRVEADFAGDRDAGERVLADGHAGGEPVGDPRRARRGEDAAALAVQRRRHESPGRARERQAGRLSRVGRRAVAGAFRPRAARDAAARRHADRQRGRPRQRHRPIDPADSGGGRGTGRDQLRPARAER